MTADQELYFPEYVRRIAVEDTICQRFAEVKATHKSQALLIYGEGGTGKTYLLRHIDRYIYAQDAIIVESVDVDDPQYWLLANLQHRVAETLVRYDPEFQSFIDYVTEITQVRDEVNLQERIHRRFKTCYQHLIDMTGRTPVIAFDTVEAIRGTDLLRQLLSWIKDLPQTLFVLAGRPITENEVDPIEQALSNPERRLLNADGKIILTNFSDQAARDYLQATPIDRALPEGMKSKLLLLTQGHPLWLALTIDYLARRGIPNELGGISFQILNRELPYHKEATDAGKIIQEDFRNTLLSYYKKGDFWSEAIKRLAVSRQWIDRTVWNQLMDDCVPPPELEGNWEVAWEQLRQYPWVRSRANERYITLHDALAEAINHFIIPIQDLDESWRQKLWSRAAGIFERHIPQKAAELEDAKQSQMTTRYVLERELEQLKAASLYYRMLCNVEDGCNYFIDLFDRAGNDFSLRELLTVQIQTFRSETTLVMFDVIQDVIVKLNLWLEKNPVIRYQIDWRIARYYRDCNRVTEADDILTQLIEYFPDNPTKQFQLHLERATVRIRDRRLVQIAHQDYQIAEQLMDEAPDNSELKQYAAVFNKEYGLYERNLGNIDKAISHYQKALRLISLSEWAELASIQANMAYALTLNGEFTEAIALARAALELRSSLNLQREIGMSYSILGEIYRYQQQYRTAWDMYTQALAIFEGLSDTAWIALIQQEQAICLFQAREKPEELPDTHKTPESALERAQQLILESLELCYLYNLRVLPSAFNRAGRIWGSSDYERGLSYLNQAIEAAGSVQDERFLFASRIEKAELCYRVFRNTGDVVYKDQINDLSEAIDINCRELAFPELIGRWDILRGHLRLNEALTLSNKLARDERIGEALTFYMQGLPLVLKAGITAETIVPHEMEHAKQLLLEFGQNVFVDNFSYLFEAWRDPGAQGYIQDEGHFQTLSAHLTRLVAAG